MAQIWQGERSAPSNHFYGGHPMGGGIWDSPYAAPPPEPSGDPILDPGPAYFVRVCGFTFEFWSLAQIETALAFYRDKIHPGTRMPTWGEHDVTQRWYERVPQYLQKTGKRERVIKALEKALQQFSPDGRPT
jgi:hypothetical protein